MSAWRSVTAGYFPRARVFCLPLNRYARFQSFDPPIVTNTYKLSPSLSLYGAVLAFSALTFASVKAMLVFSQNVLVFHPQNTNNLRGYPRTAQSRGVLKRSIYGTILEVADTRAHRRTKRWWARQDSNLGPNRYERSALTN